MRKGEVVGRSFHVWNPGRRRYGLPRSTIASLWAPGMSVSSHWQSSQATLARETPLRARGKARGHVRQPHIHYNPRHQDTPRSDPLRAGASELHLTGLEQSLLYLLAARAGQVVTRDEILDALWGVDYVSESNVVDRHVRNLRAKLQNDWRKPRFIATVPGKGYQFLPVFSDSVRAPS